jgi:hypothetical protein
MEGVLARCTGACLHALSAYHLPTWALDFSFEGPRLKGLPYTLYPAQASRLDQPPYQTRDPLLASIPDPLLASILDTRPASILDQPP